MRLVTEAPEAFDFIVSPTNTTNTTGGTAGCAVAGRLAENPKLSTLVIEAGIGNPGSVAAITTPARAFELRGGRHDWCYKTGMIDREEYTRVEKPNTRGKVLGGSSCLNYYTWIPGSKGTFDDWEAFGGRSGTGRVAGNIFTRYVGSDALGFPLSSSLLDSAPATYLDDPKVYKQELKYIGADGPVKVSHSNLLPETAEFRAAL
ncbi:Uu.00g075120.m01.CDS01 [Anthostomella pinea]|uniref:Uu.00g075120.m01.CDS01 n=1 Tax=Anthostomella pinea TaxID=933095 RepID=A0AAI8VVK5_9PEZI|nr:Uu.00g075120.m01.CDS01 [Anthostomella pinea]